MKKVFLFLTIYLLFTANLVFAGNKQIVKLSKCVDGDTAYFELNNKEIINTRFLAINTPESTNKKEYLGKEASDFTCNLLETSKLIEIEYDENSDKLDKYKRDLVWVFVDNELLQNKLINEGLAEVKYLYGDYKYTNILKASEQIAKNNKIGIWKDYKDDTNYTYVIISIIIVVVGYLYSKKIRNRINNKIVRRMKKIYS